MKNIALFALATALLVGCTQNQNTDGVLSLDQAKKLYPQTIKAADFGAIPNDGKDDAKAMRDAVKKAAEIVAKTGKGVRISVGEGKYDLMTFADGGAVMLRNLKDIMIDGEGATFIHHKMYTNFPIMGSQNITLANITFDANELPFAGAKVTAIGDRYFDCEVIAPHVVREAHPKGIISFDPKNDCMGQRGVDNYQLGTKLKIKKLSDTTMRVPVEKYAKLPNVGDTVLVRYEVYGPGVSITHGAKDVRYYNITINSHPGMGIHGSDTENILIDNLNVRAKSKDLFMSATADATHFNYCRGRIDILNSYFEKMGDDATNVHQMYWMVEDKPTPTSLKIKWGKSRDGSFPADYLPKVGDTIALGTKDNWLRMETLAKVAKVDINGKDKYAVITLETPLPDFIGAGMPMANNSSNPKLTIKNCTVRGNRARGFLIKVADATVENCKFERTSLPAILMENDANYWYEGMRTLNIKVKNCKFDNCNFWGARRPGVAILDAAAFSKGMAKEGFVNENTTVENCEFIGCGEDPIDISQTKHITVRNNKIVK